MNILFACVHNAGRSQIAAALFNRAAPPGWQALSAGTQPAAAVHPEVVVVMREVGLDLSAAVPHPLTQEIAESARLLITMGCGEACPYVPGLRRIDWPLTDPKGAALDAIRAIRDDIQARVQALITELGDQTTPQVER